MTAKNFGRVFVQRRLAAGVLCQHIGESGKVFEKIGVCEMASFEVCKKVRHAGGYSDGEQGCFV